MQRLHHIHLEDVGLDFDLISQHLISITLGVLRQNLRTLGILQNKQGQAA